MVIALLAPNAALARYRRHRSRKLPVDLPTLFVSKDSMAIRSGQQKLTVRFADGVLQLRTPYGDHDLTANIASPNGWVHPTQVIAPPKTYRATDLVTAVVTLAVPDDRKMVLRISAYPGIPAVFVKSGVTGQFGSNRDTYFWSWDGAVDTYFAPAKAGPEELKAPTTPARFDRTDWTFFPGKTGGLAVLTNGMVGYQPNQPFINPLPRWRFLRPGETLYVGFGLAGVAGPSDAAALSKSARYKSITILKPVFLTKQTRFDYGTPAPDWLRGADVCNGWYRQSTGDMIVGWIKDMPLVVGVPADKATIAKAHEAGLRVIAYVNYMELQNSTIQMAAKGSLYSHPDEATPADLLDLAKHPAWTCVDSEGKDRRSSWGASQDIPGLFSTCFHQAELRQNALTQILNIMNLGADGVFIDNACPVFECCGPKFGKHTHDDPYETNTDAYEELQKEIYKLVKSFGEDKIVMQNGGILPSHWAYSDAQMWEGFRFDDKSPEPTNDWSELQYAAEEHADAVRHGKVPVILSRFSALPADRRTDAALYTYAYSRLYGFLIADWFDLTKSSEDQQLAKAVYSIRLGKPITDAQRSGDVLYREFENGVVALNPTRASVSVSIPVTNAGQCTDVAQGRILTSSGGAIALDMGPESGRVLLRQP